MEVDPELARTIAVVVEEGTFDAAARRLQVTPSAVSQRVKTLEDQVGQRLLVRSRPVRATEAGLAVVRFAHRFALIGHDVSTELGLDGRTPRPRLQVAVNADSLATWFLEPLARFARRHDVEVDLHREDQDRTAQLLESGTVTAAVTSQAAAVAGCRVTPLGSLVYEAMAAPAWLERWAPDGVTTEALERAPRVDYDRHDRLQEQWLAHHGVAAHRAPRHLVPSSHDFTRAVVLGLGWAAVPVQHAAPLLAEGRLVPLGGPPVLTALYWQRWKGASAALGALTSLVVAEARRQLRAPG